VLAHLDELGTAFEIGLQPAERYFRHSELNPQAIEEEPVVDGVEGRRQVEADQDNDLLVVGRREDSAQDLHLTAFSTTTWVSRYQKGKTSLDLNEARDFGMQWHQLDNMQTVCSSLQTDNHTNTSSLNFYRPDALPDAQPTMSKH